MRKFISSVRGVYLSHKDGATAYFLVGSLIGALFFAVFFGLAPVNPFNIEWMYRHGGDLYQHYIGWHFFRYTETIFPLGMISGLAYPIGVPLTFMDAIPGVALVLKPFSSLLPEHFQYLGLFTFVSFILQGGFAAVILRRFIPNKVAVLAGVLLFVSASVLINRIFSHTALTAHWIILWAIYYGIVCIQDKRHATSPIFLAVWAIILTCAVMVHPYFFPMVFVLYAISITFLHSVKSGKFTSLLRYSIPPVVAVVCFGLIGGLTPTAHKVNSLGLDIYSFNLASPFDPLGHSSLVSRDLFKDKREGKPETGEKVNFLGVGILIMMSVLLYEYAKRRKRIGRISFQGVKRLIVKNPRPVIASLLLFGLLLFSLGPVVKFGSYELVTWPITSKMEKLWLIFRSGGRMFWPIFYIILIAVFVAVCRLFIKKGKLQLGFYLFVLPIVALQMVDTISSPVFRLKQREIAEKVKIQQEKVTPQAEAVLKRYCNRSHLVSLNQYEDYSDFIGFSRAAAHCQMTITEGYYSHDYKRKQIDAFVAEEKEKLHLGQADVQRNLYKTNDGRLAEELAEKYHLQQAGSWYFVESKK